MTTNNTMRIAMADALHVEPELIIEDGLDFAISVSEKKYSTMDLELRIEHLKVSAGYEIESIKALEANGMSGSPVERFGIYEGKTLIVDDFESRFEAENYLREIALHVDDINHIRHVDNPRRLATNRQRNERTYHVRRTYYKAADHCVTVHACKFRDAMQAIARTRTLIEALAA